MATRAVPHCVSSHQRWQGIRYEMPVASAQLKSAVLLAGLFAQGETVVIEPAPTRDHSECMLRAAGVKVQNEGRTITLQPCATLQPQSFRVPGDFSSAAFLLVAGASVPGSEVRLKGINLNPTRSGLLEALRMMGADITVSEAGQEAGEPAGTLTVRYNALRGVDIGGELVVRMIDEFPAFMVAALCAAGRTTGARCAGAAPEGDRPPGSNDSGAVSPRRTNRGIRGRLRESRVRRPCRAQTLRGMTTIELP